MHIGNVDAAEPQAVESAATVGWALLPDRVRAARRTGKSAHPTAVVVEVRRSKVRGLQPAEAG